MRVREATTEVSSEAPQKTYSRIKVEEAYDPTTPLTPCVDIFHKKTEQNQMV